MLNVLAVTPVTFACGLDVNAFPPLGIVHEVAGGAGVGVGVTTGAATTVIELVVMLNLLFFASATEIEIGNVPLKVGVPIIAVPLNDKPAGNPEIAIVYGVKPPVGAIAVVGYAVPTVP